MKIVSISPLRSLSPSLKAFKPARSEFEAFKKALATYYARIDSAESEENLKTHLMDFFKALFSPAHLVEQQERVDFVIRVGGKGSPAAVLVEAKRHANKTDMITLSDCNKKAMHELILYYMRERSTGNTDIQKLVICTEHEIYLFSASDFERAFFKNVSFHKDYDAWVSGKKSDVTTEFFYTQIARPFLAASSIELPATILDLRTAEPLLAQEGNDKSLVQLCKLLGPHNLIKKDLENDSNSLIKGFYDELLHIIGLEERVDNGKRIIGRLPKEKRNSASILENTIAKLKYEDDFNDAEIILIYGANNEERQFNIALELSLTWINRLLFLKLLEAQVLKFHSGDSAYRFLKLGSVADFDDLADLFFMVLAIKPGERPEHIQKRFEKVSYLNSSLFEKTRLEKIVGINALNSDYKLPILKKTVLKLPDGKRREGESKTLEYLFDFLDAYDFGTVGGDSIREESKTLINSAVLGLIFEKINNYKEGAIYTPGYVTMYMSRKVIEKTVLDAFAKKHAHWKLSDIDDLRNNITDRSKEAVLELNSVIDDLKICDPAVGSGHFLVSCLNELIALKSRLGILADEKGNRLTDYTVEVDNDELIILKADSDEVFSYQVLAGSIPARLQQVQKSLFHEKQKLIENCLFGVDINPNSVMICQLRLWIELLKSAYYRDGTDGELETLPNIDINIKCGNSLLSRFRNDQNLSDAFKKADLSVSQYRGLVASYKNTKDKSVKREIQTKIDKAKSRFQEEGLGNLMKRLDAEMAGLKAEEAQADLFVLGEEQAKVNETKLQTIREKIAALESRRAKLLQEKTFLSALEWRFEFPEVLDDAGKYLGFDVVIANPPYMRIQEIEATQPLQKEYYEKNYTTARGSYDLANLFFELAVRLSKASGSNNIFIFPHKLFNSENGAFLREYLMNTHAIKHLTHFGANQVFDSAMTYTCIALFNNEAAETFRFKRFKLGEAFETDLANDDLYADLAYKDIAEASALYGSNQWIFFDEPKGYECFTTLYENSIPLGKAFGFFVGLQTSRDSLYVAKKVAEDEEYYTILINPDGKVEKAPIVTKEFKVEKTFFRPFLMGRDVHRYQTLRTDRLVFFPYFIDGQARLVTLADLKKKYPKTFAFVTEYKGAFESRENGKGKNLTEYYAYIYEKNLVKFDQDKLTAMEICSSTPNVTVNPNGIYHSTTVYSLAKSAKYDVSNEFIAAVLNSRVFWWFLKSTGDTLQGDARRMKTNYVDPFPLPSVVQASDEVRISKLVRALIAEKAGAARPGIVAKYEWEIDQAVYKLYGFDDGAIAVIDRALATFSATQSAALV